MRNHFVFFALSIGIYGAATGGCTPTERDFGSGGEATGGSGMSASSGSGSGGSGSSGSSSSSSGGAGGGANCPPSTADCNQDGVCETNLLGDADHCGACNNSCTVPNGGMSSCVGGKCQYTCAAGTMDCDQDPSTACQDVQSDAKNCGACGHVCVVGACDQGECQPTLAFMTNVITIDPPLSLAVLGTEIHWGTLGSQVAKANLDGSAPKLIGMVNGGLGVFGLAVTNQAVYATNGNRVTIFFGMGSMWQSVNDQGVNAVAANDQYVVWTATGSNRVRRADALGGNQKDFAISEAGPSSVTLEGNVARWSNSNTGDIRESVVLDGSVAQTLFVGPPGAKLLIRDGGTFYWVVNEMVFRGVAGMPPEPLFPMGPDVRVFIADATHFYWTLGNVGEVRRAAKSAPFQPVIVAKGQAEPHAMAIGDDSVFWANRGDGAIMRLAR